MKLCYLTLPNSSLSLCLHVLYNSLRLLRVAPSGENMIRYFSFKHSWQVLVTGLKTLPLAKIFHDISYGTPSLFSSQMYLLRVVALFPSFSCLKSYMCLLYLILNVPPVSPVYVSSVCVSVRTTVAWYTSWSVLHCPSRGQVSGPPWQLHPGGGAGTSTCLAIFALCLDMACPKFGMHL